MKRKSIIFVLSVIILGMLLGTIFSLFIGNILPEGNIKDFFLLTKSMGFGAAENNWSDFGFLRFKLGFFIDISVLSILGVFVSWYILRYFK